MHVLVVEDSDRARGALVKRLELDNHTVAEAATVAEARRLAEKQTPDAAIVDILLPDGSGLDLIEPLLAKNRKMRVVIVTGYPSWQTAAYAIGLGAIEYLDKPPSFDDLNLALAGTPRQPQFEFRRPTVREHRYSYVLEILAESNGNRTVAAEKLGIPRQTLQRWLREGPPKRRRRAAKRKKR